MDVSIVIPLLNEEESLVELYGWIERVMGEHSLSYEVIFIDDGSTDSSWSIIENLAQNNESVKAVRFRTNYGKSAALYCGFERAEGDVVITMDADLQDSPDEIPALYKMITEEGYDMVSGWKRRRHDPKAKTLPSKLFNATCRAASGIKLHDFNCGLKAYRRKVVKSIEVYGEMHRYIPILAKKAGFGRIGEKEVTHYARRYGHSKYGWERLLKGYLDLITVMFVSKYGRSPMYFFGGAGTLMFLVGLVAIVWIVVEKFTLARPLTNQPLFYMSLVAILLGVILFLAGFLGEMINRNAPERNHYYIDQEIKQTRR
ncbi:MAG: glycosyltransferase family 2 protein [Tidjanibacter sp.]|nr:glycosyltransferase family 2 protein [Tidjanibacter sp.]